MHKSDIVLIESLPICVKERVELLLVYLGEKPATELIFLTSCFHSRPIEHSTSVESKLLQSMSVVDRLNLPHCAYPLDVWDVLQKSKPLLVASEGSVLEKFVASKSHEGSCILDPRSYGECCGFPDTSIDAFLGEREKFEGRYFHCPEGRFFTLFIFSKEFYRQEYDSCSRRWHNAVKNASPSLYSDIQKYVSAVWG